MPGSGRGPNGDLVVCGSCGTVKGPVPQSEWYDGERYQLCRCAPTEQHRTQPKWGDNDFNKQVELCYCCGLRDIPSGSRWSPFNCERCKANISRLNKRLGRCVVPMGRHTLMNGVTLAEPLERSAEAFGAFGDQVNALFASIDDYYEWAGRTVLSNLVALGYERGHDVLLDRYLAKAKRSELSSDNAFRSLEEMILGTKPAVGTQVGRVVPPGCRPMPDNLESALNPRGEPAPTPVNTYSKPKGPTRRSSVHLDAHHDDLEKLAMENRRTYEG